MSQLLLTRSPYRQEYMNSAVRPVRRTRVTALKWKFEFGPMALIIGLIAASIILAILYLVHFNEVATKGYAVARLEADRQTLEDQNQLSSINIDQAKAMPAILASSRIQSMVKAKNVSFVRGDSALAKADEGT